MAARNDIQKPFTVEINNFRTYNSKDNPVTMKDDEMPVLLNFMPIGQSLYSIPGYSSVLAQTPNGTTIIRTFDVNIGGSLYKMAACSDGSLYKFDAAWNRTTVAAAGTFSGNTSGPKFAQWQFTNLLIIDPNGYWDYDGTTLTKHTTLSAPAAGTSIEVWKSRVWISNGRTISYSAELSFTDFTTASGGGAVVDTYASHRNQINTLMGSADYLYVVGDHATHTITGVQVLANGSTAFTLADTVPGIGSVYPESVGVIGNTLFLMSDNGVNSITGGTYELLSSMLDGLFPSVDGTFSPVAFFANIFNKLVYCLLVKVISPLDGTKQKWLLCLYEGRWFPVYFGLVGNGAGMDLTFAGQRASSTNTTTFASYGNNIIQIFTGVSAITKRVRTKYYNLGTSVYNKQVLRVGGILANALAFFQSFPATIRIIAMIAIASTTVSFSPNVAKVYKTDGTTVIPVTTDGVTPCVIFTNTGENYGMSQCDGRGKRIAIEYDESSANQYVLAGFIVEGIIGAG